MLRNILNLSYIEHYQACQSVIWKQIHEKCESVITDSWHIFANGSGSMLLTVPSWLKQPPIGPVI